MWWLVSGAGHFVASELARPPLYTSQIDTIFAFGDSYSATGYDPDYGVDNIPGIGKTTSGGYNWLQFLASTDLTQPVALYDFASIGAVVNDSVIYDSPAAVIGPHFQQQVAKWKQYFAIPGGSAVSSAKVKWKPNRALFTIWFGINDVGLEALLLEDPVDKIPRIFGTISVLLNDLYTNGARNFLFLTIPPTERTPTLKAVEAINITDYTSTSTLFNEALTSFAATIPLAYPTTHVTTFDTQSVFNDILDAPAAHGFSDSTSFCSAYSSTNLNPNVFLPQCGWPLAEYVWYDGSHPSWRVHEILAGKVAETSSGGYSWPTYLATADPLVNLKLYNFAVGGAATNNTALYLTGQVTTIPDFPQQVATFKQYFAQPGGIATSNGTVSWESNRTVFTVFFGINDVGLEVRNGEDRRIELPQIFATWSNMFAELYALGARNFLVLSIPPTQRTPFIAGLPAEVRALYEADLSAQNEALTSFIQTIEPAYNGTKVTLFDTQPVFADVLDNYRSYGFKDNSTYCDIYASISTQPSLFLPQCGIPLAQYVWWNSGHPSWPVHQILASKIAQALLTSGVAPPGGGPNITSNDTAPAQASPVSVGTSSSATTSVAPSSTGWVSVIVAALVAISALGC
ncbi:hypothetical protein JCM3774_005315 [Rhodotorula dairenensis]